MTAAEYPGTERLQTDTRHSHPSWLTDPDVAVRPAVYAGAGDVHIECRRQPLKPPRERRDFRDNRGRHNKTFRICGDNGGIYAHSG
jgi:hypothetical protein